MKAQEEVKTVDASDERTQLEQLTFTQRAEFLGVQLVSYIRLIPVLSKKKKKKEAVAKQPTPTSSK